MGDRLFGFDSSQMNVTIPREEVMEKEVKMTFGEKGFETSLLFSITNDLNT